MRVRRDPGRADGRLTILVVEYPTLPRVRNHAVAGDMGALALLVLAAPRSSI